MKQLRGFKYRFYPTEEQRLELAQTFGCTRFVYNWALRLKTDAYYEKQEKLSYGQTSNAVTSKGFASGNPKHYSKHQARLKTLQKRLAKKQLGSNNRYKARLKVAKLHAKIADCRKDFLHKLTTGIVRENQAIYTETLAVKNMMANPKLAKAIADCGWSEALRQLEYKCEWHGRTIGAIDRWFPSSKRCNPCGHILDKLPLDVREWTCPSCNSHNLRDVNAAKNILAVGQTVIACGDTSGGEKHECCSSYVSLKQESHVVHPWECQIPAKEER